MKKQSKRRSALLMSFCSLLLCFAMLVSTTFAWFTDSVTSGVNTIQAGNLDVELTHTNAKVTTSETVAGATNLFTDKNGAAMKWEPGAVAYENFTVKNVGTLAFKYNMSLNISDYNAVTVSGMEYTLKQPLKVKVLTGANIMSSVTRESVAALNWTTAQSLDAFNKDGGKLYPAGAGEGKSSEEAFQVIVYWEPGENDNNWNVNNNKTTTDGKDLFIQFGINLVAAQLDHESDSFDNRYDKLAAFPAAGSASATIEAEKATVIMAPITPVNGEGQTTVTVPAGVQGFADGDTAELTVEASPILNANRNFTINSNGAVGAIDLTIQVNGAAVSEFKDAENNAVPVTVTTFVAKGLSDVTLQYNDGVGVQPTDVVYDAATGKLSFKTTHFSTFVLGAAEAVYVEGCNTAYLTLADAMNDASEDDTITVLKNFDIADAVEVNKNVTLDVNGKTITDKVHTNRPIKLYDATLTINGNNGNFIIDESIKDSYGLIDMRGIAGGSTGNEKLFINKLSMEGVTNYAGLLTFRNHNQEMVLTDCNAKMTKPADAVKGGYGDNAAIVWAQGVFGKLEVVGGTYEFDTIATDRNVFNAHYMDVLLKDIVVSTTSSVIEACNTVKYENCKMGTPEGRGWLSTVVAASLGGELEVNGGIYEGDRCIEIFTSGGDITINGGSFIGNEYLVYCYGSDRSDCPYTSVITLNDGNFTGKIAAHGYSVSEAYVKIYGGSFENCGFEQKNDRSHIEIFGGTFDCDPSMYLAEGFTATESNGIWTVAAAK